MVLRGDLAVARRRCQRGSEDDGWFGRCCMPEEMLTLAWSGGVGSAMAIAANARMLAFMVGYGGRQRCIRVCGCADITPYSLPSQHMLTRLWHLGCTACLFRLRLRRLTIEICFLLGMF